MRADAAGIVIVGGGIIGLAIARALAIRGTKDILLLERGNLGAEASFAAAGMLAPQAEANSCDPFFTLACRSRDMYSDFASALLEETGVDVELDATGTLYLAFSEKDLTEIEERYLWQTRAGLAVDKLTAAEARRLEPAISEDVTMALRFPHDIQVENRRLITALTATAQKHGVRIETSVTVESICFAGDRVAGVRTASGKVDACNIILAAGAWTSCLSADKALPQIRIEPVRGQMICIDCNPPIARHVIYSRRGYLVPRRDGRLLAGSTSEASGFDKRITAAGINSILSAGLEISPRIAQLSLLDCWAGLRPRAADSLPVIGPCAEIEGLYYATGHYRNGILLAPITGELVARAITESSVSTLLEPFSPNRFVAVGVN